MAAHPPLHRLPLLGRRLIDRLHAIVECGGIDGVFADVLLFALAERCAAGDQQRGKEQHPHERGAFVVGADALLRDDAADDADDAGDRGGEVDQVRGQLGLRAVRRGDADDAEDADGGGDQAGPYGFACVPGFGAVHARVLRAVCRLQTLMLNVASPGRRCRDRRVSAVVPRRKKRRPGLVVVHKNPGPHGAGV